MRPAETDHDHLSSAQRRSAERPQGRSAPAGAADRQQKANGSRSSPKSRLDPATGWEQTTATRYEPAHRPSAAVPLVPLTGTPVRLLLIKTPRIPPATSSSDDPAQGDITPNEVISPVSVDRGERRDESVHARRRQPGAGREFVRKTGVGLLLLLAPAFPARASRGALAWSDLSSECVAPAPGWGRGAPARRVVDVRQGVCTE